MLTPALIMLVRAITTPPPSSLLLRSPPTEERRRTPPFNSSASPPPTRFYTTFLSTHILCFLPSPVSSAACAVVPGPGGVCFPCSPRRRSSLSLYSNCSHSLPNHLAAPSTSVSSPSPHVAVLKRRFVAGQPSSSSSSSSSEPWLREFGRSLTVINPGQFVAGLARARCRRSDLAMTRRCAEAAPSLLQVLLALHCGVVFLQCSAASAMGSDVSALMAFKRAIIEDPHSVLSDWTDADGNACDWRGVICSAPQGSVISLKLSNSSLKGFIAPELGQLSFLQELYLDHNLLFATIPKQIGSLRNLRVLDLSVNRLTGPIPSELGGLSSVSVINFHSNGLTGSIPSELGKLQNLVELRLDRNRLKGSIPGSNTPSFSPASNIGSTAHNGLCPSPRLYVGDFSYNFLVGKIPPCLKYLPRSSFQGNCFQDEYSVQQRALQMCISGSTGQRGGTNGFKHPGHNKHEKIQQPIWLLVLEIATGVLLVVFVITGIVTASRSCKLKPSIRISSWNRSKSWSDEITVLIDSDMLKSLPKLSRQELEVACEDFSNIIGSSPETVVYKGTMKDGPEVSVISLCAFEGQWTSHHELFYQNKVLDLARLNHENIAKFLGYCRESDPFSRMLVFEYAPNGTLFEHLHYGEGGQLSWLRRMKIAIGIAQGLRYLHTELQPPFAISELNSNSVYVTEDFTPKLVDFECWKMMFSRQFSRHEKATGHLNSKSPFPGHGDSGEDKQADIQANTFAFGVILLEIISGRLPYCKDKGYLVDWATKYLQQPEEIGKLVDPALSSARSEDLAVLCSVVSRCIDPDPSKRPSMQIITGVLENGIDLSAAAILKESSLAWAELALAL